MNNCDVFGAGLTALSSQKMLKVKNSIQAIRYNGGIAIIDRRTHALMRDYLFDLSCDLEIIEKQIDQSPEHAYFVAKIIEKRLIQCGLQSDLFPDVQDKEYFVQIKNDNRKILSNTINKFDQETKKSVDVAVQYFLDLPLLKRAKNAKEGQEFLDETDSKYRFLFKQSSRRNSFLILGILGFIVNLIGSITIFFVIGPMAFLGYFYAVEEAMITESVNQTMMGVGMLLLIVVLISWAVSLLFMLLGLRKNPETTKLNQVRELARKNLLPVDEWVIVKTRFGDFNSQGYASLIEERLTYLEPLLGNREQILSFDILQ